MIAAATLRSFAKGNLVVAALMVGAWHGVRVWTESPAPTIKIRWVESLTADSRHELEEYFQLLSPEKIGPHSWNYDLIDSRQDVIKAIVEHRAVSDTGDLDRVRFTVAVTTDRGDTKRWLWHRHFTERNARRAAFFLHGWLAVSALAAIIRTRPVIAGR